MLYLQISEHEGVHYIYFYQGRISNFHMETFSGRLSGDEYMQFCCGEQYIMARKAIIMGDMDTFEKIMAETSPTKIKKLGRKVKNWNQELWDENVEQVAHDVCAYRMMDRNGDVTPYGLALLEIVSPYEKYMFVEASITDAIWGVGGRPVSAHAYLMKNGEFKGRNILGRAVTDTVSLLQ